ncbi:hypothetical protein CAPTEDRAFT_174378 [Capitella teleta]|uniref:JmjC domain-containing protein n=1 Tax=Capitella teleta TaxID=283909 RepID=R7TAT7_CAPTE|nr:hypothetical protein CAPTEDRAFT_174378 [Capitella teleta]|eukprot:ELT88607.1 hypothetical protein CAPTEDRAFT_174378 [Capitella teleta]
MDFIHKNFAYRTLPFNELIDRTTQEEQENFFFEKTEKYYLRSLGEGDVRKNRADISQDFPVLSRDITIPPFFDKQKFFSSVFRISSRKIQLWTHYDVMDNILIVVSGRKRVVLYPPSDALFLYLAGQSGDSSSSVCLS